MSCAIIGIDPGMEGALTLLSDDDQIIEIYDIEKSPSSAIWKLIAWKELWGDNVRGAVLEACGNRPAQSVKSMAKYMKVREGLWGALIALKIPLLAEPAPNIWKPAVGIALSPPKRPGKDATDEERKAYRSRKSAYDTRMDAVSREKAIALFPRAAPALTRAKDCDRAEALLMAYYGRLVR